MTMELYQSNMSVCSQKVRLVLREKNLRPAEHNLNLRAGDSTRPDYLKLNPNGVVPTLIDRGAIIVESTVICEYLEDAYPEPPLRPKDLVQRSAMRLWTQRVDTGLHAACGVISFAVAYRHQMLQLPAEAIEQYLASKPIPEMRENIRQTLKLGVQAPQVAVGLKTYDRVLGLMAQQLEQTPWLSGSEYSLADVALLPYVCRLEHLAMSWLWDDRAAIGRWLERCKARSNYGGIADYFDENYLALMRESGAAARAAVEVILRT
jgi:glutathione S-transferase